MEYGKLEGMVPVAVRMTRAPTMMMMSTSQTMRRMSRAVFMVRGRDYERIMQMRRVVRLCPFRLTE